MLPAWELNVLPHEAVLLSHPCKAKTSGQPGAGTGIVRPTSGISITVPCKWLAGFLIWDPLWSPSAGATELTLSRCQQSPDVRPGVSFLWGVQNNSRCSWTCTMSFLIIGVLWSTLKGHFNLFLAILCISYLRTALPFPFSLSLPSKLRVSHSPNPSQWCFPSVLSHWWATIQAHY